MHQICYLLAQVQKPGTDQGQVNRPLLEALQARIAPWGLAWSRLKICCHIRPGRQACHRCWGPDASGQVRVEASQAVRAIAGSADSVVGEPWPSSQWNVHC